MEGDLRLWGPRSLVTVGWLCWSEQSCQPRAKANSCPQVAKLRKHRQIKEWYLKATSKTLRQGRGGARL